MGGKIPFRDRFLEGKRDCLRVTNVGKIPRAAALKAYRNVFREKVFLIEKRFHHNGRGHAGYSLIELLVVLAIIGMIVGLVGPKVLGYLSSSRAKTATMQVQSFRDALDLYFLDVGRYPSTSEGLTALVEQPAAVERWAGPYLKTGTIPPDPWGAPYRFQSPGEHGQYDILSLGADGREGGNGDGADITSW